jgi:hypothetical protein
MMPTVEALDAVHAPQVAKIRSLPMSLFINGKNFGDCYLSWKSWLNSTAERMPMRPDAGSM